MRFRQLSATGRLYESSARSTSFTQARLSPAAERAGGRCSSQIADWTRPPGGGHVRFVHALESPRWTGHGARNGSRRTSRRSPAPTTRSATRPSGATPTRPEYRNTLDWFTRELEAIGFTVEEDPVGTLYARNRPRGEPVFGIGSHCDSNRNGGRYDGTMGVVTALEVCRLSAELGLDLPLQLISFLEEEGSGFGQMLLGSRIVAQRVEEEDLRERFRAIDDGRSFWEHAAEAGYAPERWRECAHVLDDLTGWIEMHIEQARVLQDTGNRIGLVTAIAGYVHADVGRPRPRRPRRGHADGPPARPDPPARRDDRRARASRHGRRRGHGGDGRRDRGRPGDHQRRCRRGALLARHPRAGRRRVSRRGRARSPPTPRRPPTAAE